jgi:hypothetical protein
VKPDENTTLSTVKLENISILHAKLLKEGHIQPNVHTYHLVDFQVGMKPHFKTYFPNLTAHQTLIYMQLSKNVTADLASLLTYLYHTYPKHTWSVNLYMDKDTTISLYVFSSKNNLQDHAFNCFSSSPEEIVAKIHVTLTQWDTENDTKN